jgi:nucleotide-binding universal stress UspA family protein
MSGSVSADTAVLAGTSTTIIFFPSTRSGMGNADDYRVLVPIDDDEDRARAAAEAVTTLPGDRERLTATVFHVFEPFRTTDEGMLTDSEDIFEHADLPDSVDTAVEILETEGIDVTTRGEYGDPSDEILAAAEETGADIIVMSGRKRSPTGKIIFGSISQSVLLNADRPVMTALAE